MLFITRSKTKSGKNLKWKAPFCDFMFNWKWNGRVNRTMDLWPYMCEEWAALNHSLLSTVGHNETLHNRYQLCNLPSSCWILSVKVKNKLSNFTYLFPAMLETITQLINKVKLINKLIYIFLSYVIVLKVYKFLSIGQTGNYFKMLCWALGNVMACVTITWPKRLIDW